MARARKKTVRRRPRVVRVEAPTPDITVAVQTKWDRYKLWFIIPVSIVAGVTALAQIWTAIGAKTIVTDQELATRLEGVKTEVATKLDEKTSTLKQTIDQSQKDVKNDVDKVTDAVNRLVKTVEISNVQQADHAVRISFLQKQSLQGQLATIESALLKDPRNEVLRQRKAQLEDFIKYADEQMRAANEAQRRLRGDPPITGTTVRP